MDAIDKALVKDSPTIEAMLAAYNTHQLIAITNHVPGAIAIEALPLARIKRIMKQDSCDPHPRMISADATPLMAYAAQIFIGSITSLAWQLSTTKAKRNTLQVKDLQAVVKASSRFDFLIDILDIFNEQQNQQEQQLMASPPLSDPMPHHAMSPEPDKYVNMPLPPLSKTYSLPSLLPMMSDDDLDHLTERLNATAPAAFGHAIARWDTNLRVTAAS